MLISTVPYTLENSTRTSTGYCTVMWWNFPFVVSLYVSELQCNKSTGTIPMHRQNLQRQRDRDRDRERQTDGDRDRDRETETETERDRQTETQTEIETETETDTETGKD